MLRNNYRYFIIFMIIVITIINYIDRGALSYAQAEIIKEFNLDPVSWGRSWGILDMDIYSVHYLVGL